MKKILLLSIFILTAFCVKATELNYQWKSGAAYHFKAKVLDDVSTSMMGMEMKEQFTTTTDFVLHIQNVDANGTANAILYLVSFNVVDSKGNLFASLSDIPKKAIKSDVSVDKKGNFTFLKKIYMVTTASSNVLVYGKADGNSVSAGGQAGNLKVDAYAEFDPKTGKIKAGYNVQEIENTTSVTVKLSEDTDMIDVLPYDFLELLALPEGNVALNDEVTATAGMYKMTVKVNELANGIAGLNHTMATDKSADMFGGGASGKSGDGSSMFDMNMDTDFENADDMDMDMDMDFSDDMDMDMDLGMGGFGMTGEEQGAMEMSKSMSPDMTCNITSKFNYSIGMFNSVKGTVSTNINTMGMKMQVDSKLEMVLVK